MKTLTSALGLLAVLPGVLSAQARVHISAPVLRVSLGPVTLHAGVSSRGVTVRPVVTGGSPAAGRTTTTAAGGSALAARVLSTADRYLGTRYVYGGESPASGFDCSGFVQYVFAKHGVELPRTSRQQVTAGRKVPGGSAALRPGDLMLFASTGGAIDHVAIYAGEGRILHSSRSGGGVAYDDLSSARGQWFLARHVASRRVI
ncbi:MAG TPA: C40 family peptidase [Gemmatimonadales bacterium]|nr:C40 family peptidase [Gemmatimonadales bacterium]